MRQRQGSAVQRQSARRSVTLAVVQYFSQLPYIPELLTFDDSKYKKVVNCLSTFPPPHHPARPATNHAPQQQQQSQTSVTVARAMSRLDLIDHSPFHPSPATPVSTASNLILIDNYDSFTWNVYQYLVLEGASVTVYRNDEITLQQLIDKKPTQLCISPGPGHPESDSGISKDAIKHFSGKIPILGVCMGQYVGL